MRILYFADVFWPHIGGIEVISARLVAALAERGHELVVVTGQEDESMPARDSYGDVPIVRLPWTRALSDRDLDLLARCRREIAEVERDLRPHLIHASFAGPGIWMLPRARSARFILSLHGMWDWLDFSYAEGLSGRTLERADWVTGCSRAVLDELIAAVPGVAGRSSVMLYGLDSAFEGDPPEPPAGSPRLFCSGRLSPEKGFDVAVQALATVDPEVALTIAGDGPERPALEARVQELGLSDRVTFAGWVSPDRAHELVAESTLVVVPSRSEGFGLVALEAALMARPVIAADVGGLPEVVEDGVTGRLVRAEDPGALAAAIAGVLAQPTQARALGRAGRRRALTLFTFARHLDEWEALYRRVAAPQRSAA